MHHDSHSFYQNTSLSFRSDRPQSLHWPSDALDLAYAIAIEGILYFYQLLHSLIIIFAVFQYFIVHRQHANTKPTLFGHCSCGFGLDAAKWTISCAKNQTSSYMNTKIPANKELYCLYKLLLGFSVNRMSRSYLVFSNVLKTLAKTLLYLIHGTFFPKCFSWTFDWYFLNVTYTCFRMLRECSNVKFPWILKLYNGMSTFRNNFFITYWEHKQILKCIFFSRDTSKCDYFFYGKTDQNILNAFYMIWWRSHINNYSTIINLADIFIHIRLYTFSVAAITVVTIVFNSIFIPIN